MRGEKTTTSRDGRNETTRHLRIFSFLALEVIVLWLASLPDGITLDRFAFCDPGANLSVQYLTAHGLRPAVDFGFHYGLLSLLIVRIWFAVFGISPLSYHSMELAANLVITWAIAKIAVHLQLGGKGLALLFLAIGFATQTSYPAAAHVLEAAFLALALAQQAQGRYDRALTMCTAAVLVKPSMGYFYGLVLLVLLVRQTGDIRRAMSALTSAAITGTVLAATLAVMYGPTALFRTTLPLNGAVAYSRLHYGFFRGIGRDFWLAPGRAWLFYLFDISGFWICATFFLFVSAVVALALGWKNQWSQRKNHWLQRTEMLITCALLHGIFISFLFGNQYSWFYYSYVLIIGVAFGADQWPASRKVGLVLCILVGFAWIDRTLAIYYLWQMPPPDATAGLWSPLPEREEWAHVLEMTRGNQAVVLDTKGAAELLFPGFEPPVTLFLDTGLILPEDAQRKIRQLAAANMVVVPYGIGVALNGEKTAENKVCAGVPNSMELRAALQEFEPVYQGRYFEVLRRLSAVSADRAKLEK